MPTITMGDMVLEGTAAELAEFVNGLRPEETIVIDLPEVESAPAEVEYPEPAAPVRQETEAERRLRIVQEAIFDRRMLESSPRTVRNLRGNFEPFMPSATDRVRYVVNRGKRKVTALLHNVRSESHVWAKGNAICTEDDEFIEEIGKVIALRRALGLEVPEKYTRSFRIAYLPVDRPAEAGDRIKIVAAQETGGKYANGDILTVDRTCSAGVYVDSVKSTGNYDGLILDREYVVLEPVREPEEPQYREVSRKAAAGEQIRIVSTFCTGGHYVKGDVLTVLRPHDRNNGVFVEIPAAPDGEWYIAASEYVVLEPVQETAETPSTEYREVKREANAGDRIKIVEPFMTNGRYVKGDVLTVESPHPFNGGAYVKFSDATGFIAGSEYVVLEPVTEPSV